MPLRLTKSIYIICTGIALIVVLIFKKYLVRLNNTWFIFDTFGLAFFTVAGIQKSLMYGFPFWVAIIMGCITGAAGGIVRDVLINEIPLIFRKEIYALASIAGGLLFLLLSIVGVSDAICAIVCFLIVVLVRVLAVKYRISLPHLKAEDLER